VRLADPRFRAGRHSGAGCLDRSSRRAPASSAPLQVPHHWRLRLDCDRRRSWL